MGNLPWQSMNQQVEKQSWTSEKSLALGLTLGFVTKYYSHNENYISFSLFSSYVSRAIPKARSYIYKIAVGLLEGRTRCCFILNVNMFLFSLLSPDNNPTLYAYYGLPIPFQQMDGPLTSAPCALRSR